MAVTSLTYDQARARAELLHGLRTVLHLDLTSPEDFLVRARIEVGCTRPGAETFLELRNGRDVTVLLNGQAAPGYDGARIPLPDLAADNVVEVTARMPYVTDGDGMTQMTDPVDGERYVCGFTGMDVAQKIVPCFDQPDLKTTVELTVDAPAHWTVLANGREVSRSVEGAVSHWAFAPTPPISSYLFTVYGGPWASVTWEEPYGEGTLPFGWHARASQRELLERDADVLREITSRCFAHYTSIFEPAYPFDDYQQVFAPQLNWGAMEFPGCVAFRDEMLTRGEPTALEQQWRASVIAHEMAHMWFGNLVTPSWWEDSWLNESFADYMGYEVADVAAGYGDSWTAAALGRKPTAYRADRRRSTHRIAEDPEALVDVDTAFTNFDMITYAKGNAVLRQLVTWLGEEDFLDGVNAYLRAHAFGNASLADFLDALAGSTDRDVRTWAEDYLRSTGFDTIHLDHHEHLEGVPTLRREGTRPHRFSVAVLDDDLHEVERRMVDLGGEPVRLPDLAGRLVVPNAGDEAYAALAIDEPTWTRLLAGLAHVESPLTRALLWATAAARAESGHLSVGDLVGLGVGHLTPERHPVVFDGALTRLLWVVRRYADAADLPTLLPMLSELLLAVLRDPAAEALWPAAARAFPATGADRGLLASWLAGAAELRPPDQDVRWSIVQRLAALGDPSFIEPETERDPSAGGALKAMRARSATPDPAVKEQMWKRLMSGRLSNREVTEVAAGFWTWDQPDLAGDYALRYVVDALDLARRSGQGMGQVIGQAFPWLPQSTPALTRLRADLAAALAGDVPTVLARSWDDALDDLDRVLAART